MMVKYCYYSERDDLYYIKRHIDGLTYCFGTYKTKEAAELAVELFEKYGWDPKDNWKVKSEVKEILGDLK